MTEVKKSGASQTVKPVTEDDLAKINRFTLAALTAEDVFTFDVNACDTQADRDYEQFSKAALDKLAELFIGKTVIFDHTWSAGRQTARIYDSQVIQDGEVHRLRLSIYMLTGEDTQAVRSAICGGILREVSVGCAVRRAVCSVCGKEYGECGHRKGERYGGTLCTAILEDPVDAYELSFVAVPAQRDAAVTKMAGVVLHKTDKELEQEAEATETRKRQIAQAMARVDLYEKMTKI
ncbi:MAG: hypothetical protein IKB79_04925 [Oscillospiraceae bacterium]|nr:hypothetical protein [Oscillospiraceae bacterium]